MSIDVPLPGEPLFGDPPSSGEHSSSEDSPDDLQFPADEALWDLVGDLDSDPPDTSGTSGGPGRVPPFLGAGYLSRDDGPGFPSGGALDRLPPGPVLAGFADDTWFDGLEKIADDQLIGILRGWRRLASWAAAGELAAVAELARRRHADVAAGGDSQLADYVNDELAVALTLTRRAADGLLGAAWGLERLPLTRAALAAGLIDRARAMVIVDEVSGLDDVAAATVETHVLGRAPGQTTGQLRASARRAALAIDPSAADRRREEAQRDARIEVWGEKSGTAGLAGRDLPPADVLAADMRIDSLARWLKKQGMEGNLDQVRARVYTALLLGLPLESLLPAQPAPDQAGSAQAPSGWPSPDQPSPTPPPALGADGGSGVNGGTGAGAFGAGTRLAPPALTGSVNLTMPLASWLGSSGAPGDVAGFGPVGAADCRALAEMLAREPGSRWCITLTGPDGRAVAHGCARSAPVTVWS